MIPGFVSFLVAETRSYFKQHLPEIDIEEYFKAMKQDDAFQYDEGQVVKSFKSQLELALK